MVLGMRIGPNISMVLCSAILLVSIGWALLRRHDSTPCVVELPDPSELAAIAPNVVPAPAAAQSRYDDPVTRELVSDSVSLSRVAELEQENARLRTKIEQLEANLLPTTQAQMAIAIGQPEDVVRHALGRTQVLNDAAILGETLRAIGPQRTWDALQAEAQFYRNNVQFRALNGEPNGEATWEERAQWHRNVWVPHMTTSVATFCDQLYRLGLPSPAIESFRKRMEEGL